jgi:hypothetical protein
LDIEVTMTSIHHALRAFGDIVDDQQNPPVHGRGGTATNTTVHPISPSLPTFAKHVDDYAYPYTGLVLNFLKSRHTGN